MNIKIKIAKPEDARASIEVFYSAWLATYPNTEAGITVEDIEYRFKDRFTYEHVEKVAERIHMQQMGTTELHAKKDGQVVGVCVVRVDEEKNTLGAIYVLPEFQRHGIGGMLWSEAQKYFDADKDVYVHVVSYNTKAQSFYKKLGFERTGKIFTEEKFRMKSGAIFTEVEMVRRVSVE